MASYPYPVGPDIDFGGQPSYGAQPSLFSDYAGASDTRYSGGTAPIFQQQLDRIHGRYLAGLGSPEVQDEQGEANNWYPNELKLLAMDDDVQGNGVFDAPGTEPNLHVNAGVFAGHASIPGYSAREKTWLPSEVIDSTTGRPVIPVLAGAVAMDSAAQIAFLEKGMYAPPEPVIDLEETAGMQSISTVNPRVHPQRIGRGGVHGLGAATYMPPAPSGMSTGMKIGIIAALGLAVGAVAAAALAPKRAQNKRRH